MWTAELEDQQHDEALAAMQAGLQAQQDTAVKQLLNRWLQRGTASALHSWRSYALHRRYVRSVCSRLVRRLRYLHVSRAMSSWSSYRRTMARARQILRKLQNRAVVSAFSTWLDLVDAARSELAAAQQASERAALQEELQSSEGLAIHRLVFLSAKLWQHRKLSKCLSSWQRWAVGMALSRDLLRQATLRVANVRSALAFGALANYAAQTSRASDIMWRISLFRLSGTFLHWRGAASRRRQSRSMCARARSRLARSRLGATMYWWREATGHSQAQRLWVRLLLQRRSSRSVRAAWVDWVDWAATQQMNQRVAEQKAMSQEQLQSTIREMESSHSEAITLKDQELESQVQKLAKHEQDTVTAFGIWYQTYANDIEERIKTVQAQADAERQEAQAALQRTEESLRAAEAHIEQLQQKSSMVREDSDVEAADEEPRGAAEAMPEGVPPTKSKRPKRRKKGGAGKKPKGGSAAKRRAEEDWRKEHADSILSAQQNLVAASYTGLHGGGSDLPRLFRALDRNNSGKLEFEEFAKAIREKAQIDTHTWSQADVGRLYDSLIGVPGQTGIDQNAFEMFCRLGSEDCREAAFFRRVE